VVSRSANGTKPDDDYLTPREAADALTALWAARRLREWSLLAGAA
jgi:hypothetical protein